MKTDPAVVLITDRDAILFDPQNIRPRTSIAPDRVSSLAQQIASAQRRGAGYFGSGIEQPVIVYIDEDGAYRLLNGQERLLAVLYLVSNDAGYNFVGIPAEVRSQPANLWDSTRLQVALHDIDPINIIDMARRAVELKNAQTDGGKPATWNNVADVLGHNPPFWSHHQHLLNCIPELQDLVLSEKVRGQTAAVIGRDLSKALQHQHLDELVAVSTNLYRLQALIRRILDADTISKQLLDDYRVQDLIRRILDDPDTISELLRDDVVRVETNEDDSEQEEATEEDEDPAADPEALYLVRQAIKVLTRLEILAGENRLAGILEDLAQIGQRFLDLENL